MFKTLTISLIAISLFTLSSLLVHSTLDYGQLGKQTFAAEMIRSHLRGQTLNGIFPLRHFLEPNHNEIIPWAEEVPLYTILTSSIAKVSTLSVEHSGKAVSFIAFLFLIYGFYALTGSPLVALSAALFPVFRLYSVQVMPDLCMASCLVWAIVFARRERFFVSSLFIFFACIFKYYAVFTGMGLALSFLIRALTQKDKKVLFPIFLYALACLPCVLYIAYFIHAGIPNPITEYRANDGHGHLASLSSFLIPSKWLRVFTWLFIKNSTLLGSALALFGVLSFFKTKNKDEKIFYASLLLGWALFPILFLESFYVHDYYGIQGSIGTAFFAGMGLVVLSRLKTIYAAIIACIFMGWTYIHVDGMARPLPIIQRIQDFGLTHSEILKNRYGVSVSGISKPVVTYQLDSNAWVASTDEFFSEVMKKRLRDPSVTWFSVFNFTDDPSTSRVLSEATRNGFNRTLISINDSGVIFELRTKN